MEKIYLCIGAGQGIGLATALRFSREGFTPVLVSRNEEHLKPLAQEIWEKTGQKAIIESADAGNARDIQNLGNKYPIVDVLHYNAAVLHEQTLAEASYEDLSRDITVGLTGGLYSLKAFAPGMLQRKNGTIMMTSGAFAFDPLPQFLTLGVAKAGLGNIVKALAGDFAQNGVHIAEITIYGVIPPRSEKTDAVAEIFWSIHSQPKNQWGWNEDYK